MKKQILCIASFLAALTACSVKTGIVPNRPPDIPENVQGKLSSGEYGTLEMKEAAGAGISLFFWPAGLNEEQVKDLVRGVNSISREMDSLAEFIALKLPAVRQAFVDENCASFAVTADANIDTEQIEWKPATDEASTAAIARCQEYQKQNAAPATYATKFQELLGKVGPENWKEVNKNTSQLVLNPPKKDAAFAPVTMKLKIGNLVYSTAVETSLKISGAVYVPSRRILQFAYSELNADRKPTGAIYHATLERTQQDFLGLARFKGDVVLMSPSGQALRNGSIQILGQMN